MRRGETGRCLEKSEGPTFGGCSIERKTAGGGILTRGVGRGWGLVCGKNVEFKVLAGRKELLGGENQKEGPKRLGRNVKRGGAWPGFGWRENSMPKTKNRKKIEKNWEGRRVAVPMRGPGQDAKKTNTRAGQWEGPREKVSLGNGKHLPQRAHQEIEDGNRKKAMKWLLGVQGGKGGPKNACARQKLTHLTQAL